jgi:hypothetical protein
MEPTTARTDATTAPKTDATTAPKTPKTATTAKPGTSKLARDVRAEGSPERKARRNAKTAAKTPKGTKTAAKATAAKVPNPKATGPRLTGPTPERIELARTVAKLRKSGAKWNEVAAATGKAEPTLAKLRIDVRAGVFANVSPVAKRTPKDAF